MNCKFDDLFLIPKTIRALTQLDLSKRTGRLYRKYSRKYFRRFYDRYIDQEGIDELLGQQYEFTELNAFKRIYITTCERFNNSVTPFCELVPMKSLQRIIDSYLDQSNNVVGVHIRRTDSKKSIQYSPTSKFIDLMRSEIDENNEVKFFIATDSPEEEQQLKEAFPDRIMTHCKVSLNRNDTRAIQDALVDLYCFHDVAN